MVTRALWVLPVSRIARAFLVPTAYMVGLILVSVACLHAAAPPRRAITRAASVSGAAPIRSAANVRRLSGDSVAGAPVHLRGVVTALSGWKDSFFLQDATAGISVDRRDGSPDRPQLRPGDEVEVIGVSGPGLFAPVVLSDRVRVVGRAAPPVAGEFAWDDLTSGSLDSQWIQAKGIVRGARVAENWGRRTLFLDVRTPGGMLQALVHDFPDGYDFSPLIDSPVTLQGVCGTNFNDRRQILGVRLFVPSLDYVRVQSGTPADPFAAPLLPMSRLLHFGTAAGAGHRVMVEGTVTFADAEQLFLQQGGDAIHVRLAKPAAVRIGSVARAAGFVGMSGYSPDLEDAVAVDARQGGRSVAGEAAAEVAPSALIVIKDGFAAAPYSDRLISVEAEILDMVQRGGRRTLLLKAGDISFHASIDTLATMRLPLGSRLRLTGICRIESGADRVPRDFNLLLRSEADIVVFGSPFWTLARASWLVGGLFIILCWVLLRRGLVRTGIAPPPQVHSGIAVRFSRFSRGCALAAGLLGLVVLTGWIAANPVMASLLPGYAPMVPNAAIGVMLLSLAIWLDGRQRAAEVALSLLPLLVGVAGMAQILTNANLHINLLLVKYPSPSSFAQGAAPGRLAAATCLNFVLLGMALQARLLFRREDAAQALTLASSVLCLLHGMRLLVGWESFGTFSVFGMALAAVVVFSLLCGAVLFARPGEGIVQIVTADSSGGILSRRLLPAAILIPAALSWLCRQGELDGFYGTAFGVISLTTATIVVFALIILLASALLNRMDSVRSRAETEVRVSQRRLAQLADAMPQIVWSALPSGSPEYFNRRWFEYSGQDPAHIGQAEADIAVHPEDRERRSDLWQTALKTGDPYSLEVRFRRFDGQYRWHLERVLPIADLLGRPVRWIGTCTDIEDYKRTEGSLQRLNLHLEARVEERTAQAMSASRAKDQFLATVSHEIRTPMNAILGFAGMLASSRLDAEQRNWVEICLRAGTALMSLIDDVLDLSKIEAGGLDLENIPFDLRDIPEQAVELAAPKARSKKLVMMLRIAPGLTRRVVGDPARLRQVLLNLLGNAAKFTHTGEIILNVANIGPPESGRVAFAVSDTGIGIAPDKLDVIFEDFRQADSSTTRLYGGTGLGLGISRRLVERMGGRLSVESKLGVGSTFGFELQFEVAVSSSPDLHDEAEPLRGRTIRVIDENAASREILIEILSSWGMKCAAAGPPDLALIACHSDETGGLGVAESLRSLLPGTPIVLLTSEAPALHDARRTRAELAGHALEPLRRNHLARLLSNALRLPATPEASVTGLDPKRSKHKAMGGLRILVAEDMPDNQLLFQAYLDGKAHSLIFAEDGQAAFEAYRSSRFDLIVMDTRMPVMDGLAATRAIREYEKRNGMAPTPILAVSADAHPADATRSLAAGCQEHLSKPVSAQELLAAIERHSRPRGAEPAPADLRTPGDRETRLREKIKKMAPGYLEDRERDLARTSTLMETGNFPEVRVIGHNMKGTGASFGFPEISHLGASLEAAADCGEPEAVRRTLHELSCLMANLRIAAIETEKRDPVAISV